MGNEFISNSQGSHEVDDPPCGSKRNMKLHDVLLAVCESTDAGITTREVAERCDLSVYSARNWLMKLEKEGCIYKIARARNSTWHHY